MNTDILEHWESQANAARITGIPARTIRSWLESGKIKKNGCSYVDIIELFQRDIERKQEEIDRLKQSNPENPQHRLILAQVRKTIAEAGLKELELDQARGKVIDFEQAKEEFQTALYAIRAKFLALPSRLALQLSGLNEPKLIANVLTSVIDECLRDLSVSFSESAEAAIANEENLEND